MNSSTNGDMKEYLDKRSKNTTSKNTKSKKFKLDSIISLVKSYWLTFAKYTAFIAFVFFMERTFYRMRVHIAKNGGIKRQGM